VPPAVCPPKASGVAAVLPLASTGAVPLEWVFEDERFQRQRHLLVASSVSHLLEASGSSLLLQLSSVPSEALPGHTSTRPASGPTADWSQTLLVRIRAEPDRLVVARRTEVWAPLGPAYSSCFFSSETQNRRTHCGFASIV
jgi:hypothetical protein